MARLGDVYRGPEMPAWRRLLLRHSRSTPAALFFTAVCIVLATVAVGWRPGPFVVPVAVALFALMAVAGIWAARERDRLVREAPLPYFLRRKLVVAYPHLSLKDAELVERGLRQFFLACQRSHRKFVAMPSQVVDSMWHEFILHTSAYREWCELVVGRFVDHVPAEVLGRRASSNDGLRRAWYWACKDESIKPRAPSRLPLLFALDAKFAIPGGFFYVADCRGVSRDGNGSAAHCGESFSDGSYSGDADSFGGSESSGGNGGNSSDGGGSDGGCGSGCGGGGD